MTINRRRLLELAVKGAAGVIAAPYVWIPRTAHAASGLAGPTGGAIVFVLNGGARTQAIFNGAVNGGVQPFGTFSTGLSVPLSQLQQNTPLATPAINQRFNLVSTAQHHNRTGNHTTGRVVACTGYTPEENKPGILTVLNYAFASRQIPCVSIGNDTPATLIGSEISSTYSPIKISSPLNIDDIKKGLVDVRVSMSEKERLDALRYGLQDRFLRSTRYKEPADIPFFQRRAEEVGQQFEAAALDIRNNAAFGKYTDNSDVQNAALRTSFGVTATGGGSSLGAQAMLAVRLRQLGCAGITVSSNNWDFHSNELNVMPNRAAEVGRCLGALIDHMSRIRDPLSGKTLLETTVVTVVTDFNRGNWSVGSGFNGNNGSDHRSNEDKTAFQCIPLFGGGLPGGKVLGAIRQDGSPDGSSPRYETRQVLATVLDVLGVEYSRFLPASAVPLTQDLTS